MGHVVVGLVYCGCQWADQSDAWKHGWSITAGVQKGASKTRRICYLPFDVYSDDAIGAESFPHDVDGEIVYVTAVQDQCAIEGVADGRHVPSQ